MLESSWMKFRVKDLNLAVYSWTSHLTSNLCLLICQRWITILACVLVDCGEDQMSNRWESASHSKSWAIVVGISEAQESVAAIITLTHM